MKTEELKKLVAKATPGPWQWATSNSWRRIEHVSPGLRLAVMQPFVAPDGHPDTDVSKEDARLIAIAPDLAREVLALRQRVEAAEKMAEAIHNLVHGCDLWQSGATNALAAFRATGGEG